MKRLTLGERVVLRLNPGLTLKELRLSPRYTRQAIVARCLDRAVQRRVRGATRLGVEYGELRSIIVEDELRGRVHREADVAAMKQIKDSLRRTYGVVRL